MCSKEWWESPITLISPPGQRIVVVRCEKINISGSFYRNKCKYMYIYMACECVGVACECVNVTCECEFVGVARVSV